MRTTEIWTAPESRTLCADPSLDPVWLSREGVVPDESSSSPPRDAILLLATAAVDGACGVVMVPDGSEAPARLNGTRLNAGLHVARHGDSVSVGGASAWFGVSVTPDKVVYDPKVHGDPVYCLRTKARLAPGDEMVICPGNPGVDCGMMFRASAWIDSLPCHHCGTLPSKDRWQPPPAAQRRDLAQRASPARGRQVSTADDVRFARLRATVTFAGSAHDRWCASTLAVVGAGAVGGPFARAAARSGARLRIYDLDVGEAGNQGNQHVVVGEPKAASIAGNCNSIVAECAEAYVTDIRSIGPGAFEDVALIVDCTDDPALAPALTGLSNGWAVPMIRLAVDGTGRQELARMLVSHGGAGHACQLCGESAKAVDKH